MDHASRPLLQDLEAVKAYQAGANVGFLESMMRIIKKAPPLLPVDLEQKRAESGCMFSNSLLGAVSDVPAGFTLPSALPQTSLLFASLSASAVCHSSRVTLLRCLCIRHSRTMHYFSTAHATGLGA